MIDAAMISGAMKGMQRAGGFLDASASQGSAAQTPFAGVFRSMVEQTSSLDRKASQAVTGLLTGQGVEIHDAMIATQKADIAFELALEVRNKAVGAYQQMMNMQF
ncbi:MAG TPA: flagellar hook-basal body complex protein FliE [Edaphobacter sp.]|nr:flagellar hook-basal body complex protein FliE [Edaphobacter sp.]